MAQPPHATRVVSTPTVGQPALYGHGTKYQNQDSLVNAVTSPHGSGTPPTAATTTAAVDVALFFGRHQPPTYCDDTTARDWWIASFGQSSVAPTHV
jgi:hypothetical protein